jgi:glutamate dehydrogenase/leucine dehydrogenase
MNNVVASSLCAGLTLSDFHLFGPLKGSLRGHFYVADEALWNALHQWMQWK